MVIYRGSYTEEELEEMQPIPIWRLILARIDERLKRFKSRLCQLWDCKTGIQVYKSEDLYNALDDKGYTKPRPWWKSKAVVVRCSDLVLDRHITVERLYFATAGIKIANNGKDPIITFL